MSEPYWSALGGGGAVDYKGAWAAGTQYQSGDVVRQNGVDFIAVNPSLGVDPGVATGLAVARELAYVEFSAVVSITSTAMATPDVVITAPSVTFDGLPVLIDFSAPYVHPASSAGAVIYIQLWEDGVALGILAALTDPASAQVALPARITRRMTPTAAAHTYSIRANTSSGAGAVGAGVGGPGNYFPGSLRISKVVV